MIYQFLDLWNIAKESSHCRNFTLVDINSSYSGQYKCQNECMNEDDCVGINWSYREGNGHLCSLCLDDRLYTSNDYFDFFRKRNQKVDGKYYWS